MMDKSITKQQRLMSLDVFRGITIAAMILVNNPGSWSYVYTPLGHAEWNGLTPTDLIYPFFILIMGISMYLSFRKFDFKFSKQTFIKVTRRAILLFLIGLFLHWFGLFFRTFNSLIADDYGTVQTVVKAALNFENLRILGVLQRLALVAFFGSLIVLLVKPGKIPWIVAGMLVLYWIIIGVTDSYYPTENNIIAVVDRLILGPKHMYTDRFSDGTCLVFEPEGIVSTLPSIAQVLIGFLLGKIIVGEKDWNETIRKLLTTGAILLFIGCMLHYGFPINKKIWSSSFVLVTSGFGALFLGLLIWIIDVRGKKSWSSFFVAFGVNPLFIYVVSAIIAILFINVSFSIQEQSLSIKTLVYNKVIAVAFNGYLASLIFAILFVILNWGIAHILYKRKLFIKL